MERLSTALRELRSKLNNTGEISVLLDKVLNEYNVIAHMTTHGVRFQIIQQDTDDKDARNTDDEENYNTEDRSTSDLSEFETISDGDDTDDSKHGNETTEGDKSINDDTAQQKKVTERDDKHTTNSDEPFSGSNQAEVCTNRYVGLDNIVAYIKSLNRHGVTCGGMTGKKH